MFGDISKTFGRSFLIAHLLPAAILCSAVVLSLKAGIINSQFVHSWRAFGLELPVFLLIVIFGFAVLLSLLSKQIVMTYEGYNPRLFLWYGIGTFACAFGLSAVDRRELTLRSPFEWLLIMNAVVSILVFRLHRVGKSHHLKGFEKALKAIDDPNRKDDRVLLRYEFSRAYPRDAALVLPTKFGNILKAFEHYPNYMFKIDPITIWYRLMSVVPEQFKAQLEDAEAGVQFFLNMASVTLALAFGVIYAALEFKRISIVGFAVPLAGVAYQMYWLACDGALDWGEQVRSTFELYRFDLLKQLSVATPELRPWTLETERTIWTRVQRVTFQARPDADTTFEPSVAKPAKKAVDDIDI